MADEPTDADTPEKIASLLRRLWGWYQNHNTILNGVAALTTLILGILAYFAPSSSDLIGQAIVIAATSNATSNFLLLVVIGLLVVEPQSGRAGSVRTDGGSTNDDATKPILTVIFGFLGAIVGSGFGDQWALPGFMAGVTIYLYLQS